MRPETQEYIAGKVICKQGDPVQGVHLILTGTVLCSRTVQEENVELYRLGRGDYFGDVELVSAGRFKMTVTAESHCRVSYFSRQQFHELLDKAPVGAKNLIRTFIDRLQRDNTQVVAEFGIFSPFLCTAYMLLLLWRRQESQAAHGRASPVRYRELCEAVKDMVVVSLFEIQAHLNELEDIEVVRLAGKTSRQTAFSDGATIELTRPKEFLRRVEAYSRTREEGTREVVSESDVGFARKLAEAAGMTEGDVMSWLKARKLPQELLFLERRFLRGV